MMWSSSSRPNGDIALRINKNKAGNFRLMLRIPGWVRGQVVPSDLYAYADGRQLGYTVSVNGQEVKGELQNGYFVIERKWKKGDAVRLHFDMAPRMVTANNRVADDRGKVSVERGPLVYCAEWPDNTGFSLHHGLLKENPDVTVLQHFGIRNTVRACR